MAMVAGICPKCQKEIQVEQRNMSFFCLNCGDKATVSHAVALYEYAHPEQKLTGPAPEEENEKKPDQESAESIWKTILAKTDNLKPSAIRHLADYAHEEAHKLFTSGLPGVEKGWHDSYMEALEASCRMAVEAVDPRVFIELKIYQWYPRSNTYLYPISKDFDIQPILDKELWAEWNPMIEALPEGRRGAFKDMCDGVCRQIRDYFLSGFHNMKELQNGDLSRLLGTWRLKLTTGLIKTEVLSFFHNAVGVPHLEAYRTTVNSYDYYRYIKMDQSNHITAGEHRRFPSATGLGGDFYTLGPNAPIMGLMAVYKYILVLPTALYVRTEPNKIPGNDKAMVFIEKCRAMPCFHRDTNLKHSHQMRSITENHDTAEPTRRMRACYIATAVYGDIDAPQVQRLRRYRDEKLNNNRLGRRLCALYYRFSPRLAHKMTPSGTVSRTVRRILDGFLRRLGE
jgi:hypothetical protein